MSLVPNSEFHAYSFQGSYAGNAPGFRLKDLSAFAECKSNQPDFTLLDFVVRSLVAHDGDALLRFHSQLSQIDSARRVSLDDVREEIANLRARVRRVENAFETTAPDIRDHMQEFVEVSVGGATRQPGTPTLRKFLMSFCPQSAKRTLEKLSKKLNEANEMTKRLASWFCEDLRTFDVEDCYLVFHSLCTKLTASMQASRIF